MRPTADLYDANASDVATCSVQFRSFGARRRFFGPLRTINCRNDNVLLRTLLSEQGNGAVVVVDGGGSTEVALMGDNIAAQATENGWAGIIVRGAVRDSASLARIDLGILALGVNPARSGKNGTGSTDEPIEFGGVRFRPGEWVYSDEDGILVSPSPLE